MEELKGLMALLKSLWDCHIEFEIIENEVDYSVILVGYFVDNKDKNINWECNEVLADPIRDINKEPVGYSIVSNRARIEKQKNMVYNMVVEAIKVKYKIKKL